ncbi:uncharacterized protein LOC123709237 [Pieris brassicae]|uniref:uncharacterized protein LOC123709237 n=1 Tax=Pieris brassicae TaxID=7116 RepID=UPI001E66292F|nr:uncharacterized protein LOC123709237 [Pieris brassicae]XP_045516331.1 uncharacterized protein LOC123709237 [Pieris brassicae]XP_045516332.1 uncharacterized protein LOC123709237 [Pieris brassicae]XP_045516333.1 uncharacterized protein LOC123709237 [Pieris brassicae]
MTAELQGHHLGARHKYLNLLSKPIDQEYVSFENIDISAGDIINIVKIDLASKNRNINYILIVLQCEDMLYISRALKQCPWLISDNGYENIFNPEYLHKVLYPKMTTKAVTKLKKYIKLNLKECQRVEQFYAYEENEKEALEWLPNCSPEFIVTNFKKHIYHVDIPLLKRLCEKTIEALEIYLNSNIIFFKKQQALQATTFLLKIDLKKYLELVEKDSTLWYNLKFNSNCTKYILTQDASRIMNNFEFYYSVIDIKTFLNHLKKGNVKHFLYKLFEDKKSKERGFIKFEMLVNFLTAMPEADRLETVKQVFLEKIHLIADKCHLPKPLRISMNNLYTFMYTCKWHFIYDHYWYRFTSFEFAYPQIIKIISNEMSVEEINSIVETLIIVAGNSEKYLTELVEYLCKNYKNGDPRIKKSLIANILKHSVSLNKNTWEKIKNTFMGEILNETDEPIYDENFVQLCAELIIIHELIFNGKISDIIHKRFKFNSLKTYRNKLPEESREKLFEVLLNWITNKINIQVELNKKEYLNKVDLLDSVLNLLNDWNKELCDYPVILKMITDFVKVNEENSWDIDFSKIYNKNKSWRKDLFAVSLKMHPSQSVLLNILKHDPSLLEGYYYTHIENKVYRKGISLDQFHKKLKIFWPESISKQLVHTFEQQLKSGTSNKAMIRALCICMPRNSLLQLLIQYIPQQDVINWATIDEGNLNIQQNLAMNMHVARPQPRPEIVLDYAKGDHVAHSLPALYSIFYNLNWSQSQKFIPMLLNKKVSLQKHGIRLAFIKLLPMEVKKLLTEVLNENKNLTIRHVAFTLTFKVLCKQKDSAKIQHLWPIMDNFLNDLTHEENKAIYDLLFQVENLPRSVQPQFFCKAYMFLKSLMTSKKDYYAYMKYSFKRLYNHACENCNQLPPEFLKSILLEYINELPNKDDNFHNSSKIELLSAFILCSDTKESLSEKCQSVLIPFLQKCFKHWNNINKDVENKEIIDESMYFVRLCFHEFMYTFSKNTKKFISEKNTIVPIEAFEIIQNEFVKFIDTTCYYLTLTMLQLNYTFLIIFESCKKDGDDWDKTCSRMLPGMAQAFSDHLKDHCNKYFTHVYVLFEIVLHTVLTQYLKKSMILEFLKNLLNCENFIPLYLVVIKLLCYYSYESDEDINTVKDLLGTISSHTSPEVQIHYYQCHNIQLKSITESMICDSIKQKYDKNVQVDS